MSRDVCSASIRKVKRLGLTAFVASCGACGWEGPITGREKAELSKGIHDSGGKIIGHDVPVDPRVHLTKGERRTARLLEKSKERIQ